MSVPVIYLDTQDYSRFGDVLRGKSDTATETLFLELEARKQSGNAIFAVSMPILGELLQYDSGHRETTIRKAEAVERLCGSWALAFPSRLIAAEIIGAVQKQKLFPCDPPVSVLSSDRYWYPDISEIFVGLRAQIQGGVSSELATMGIPSRAMRRQAKKLVVKMDVAAAARDAAPQMADKYGLPVEVFTRSIVALLQNKITPEQASRALFEAVAQPIKFVEMYFETVETDRTLPSWLSGFGRDIESQISTMRDKVKPILASTDARKYLKGLLERWPTQLAPLPIRMAEDEIAAHGINADQSSLLAADPSFLALVPSAQIIGRLLPAYVSQTVEQNAGIESSFGGDLVHALYLPHVDLWRADRRFSALTGRTLPEYAGRIISTLKSLPASIDTWNLKNA